MAFFAAVANRKGGVGKSTITVMLAHALAVWGSKRVLILDLDSQCNTSLILLGGQGWNEARKAERTIADYFFDLFDGNTVMPKDYLIHGAGDVAGANGKAPTISLLPGSLMLEDVQGELYLKQAKESNDPDIVANRVGGRIQMLLRKFEGNYDVVLLDCPPGLSFAALAALKIADRVIVPFRPDYVSELAVDRISLIIEDKRNQDALDEVPIADRRYVCLANYVRDNGRDRLLIEEIGLKHPVLDTQLPMRDGIANAFDYIGGNRQSLADKYGNATEDLRRLYDEVSPLLSDRHSKIAAQ
ncbi:MAG: chromosome partitioning protein [Hyphomicrobium sp.]|nr:MAG: chromosome partitioning protein [Hyphomicrobium sp.]